METVKEPMAKVNAGIITDDWIFVTHRNPEHYFRNFRGFGISLYILEQLIARGIREIKVLYHGKKGERVYMVTPYNWKQKGKLYKHEDFEQQIILAETDFDKVLGGVV
jgi:hypothetical protein